MHVIVIYIMVVSSDSDYCLELHISLTNTRDNQGNLKKERKLEQRGLVQQTE